jgi:hypothetical protein
MAVIPDDTSPDAHRVQRDVYLRLGGRGRLALMFRLNDEVRRLAMAGIRARHPDYTDAEAFEAHMRLVLGDALAEAIWRHRERRHP